MVSALSDKLDGEFVKHLLQKNNCVRVFTCLIFLVLMVLAQI
jgi:hypothetical protein